MNKICPNCGKDVSIAENYCPFCGLSFSGKKRYSNREDIGLEGWLLLCCCFTPLGALIYYLASQKD